MLPIGAEVIAAVWLWMPSTLVGALTELADGASPADFLRSAGVAIAMTAACLFAATRLLELREL